VVPPSHPRDVTPPSHILDTSRRPERAPEANAARRVPPPARARRLPIRESLAASCSPTLASLQARIRQLRDDGMGMLKIGKKLGIGTSVVQRLVSEDAR